MFSNQSGDIINVSVTNTTGRCWTRIRLVRVDRAAGSELNPSVGEAGPFDLSLDGAQRLLVVNMGYKIQLKNQGCKTKVVLQSARLGGEKLCR